MPRGKLIHFSNDHVQFIKELQNEYNDPAYTFISKQLYDKFGDKFSPWSIKNLIQDMKDSPKLYGGDLMSMAADKLKSKINKGETMQRQGTKLLSSELSHAVRHGIEKKPDTRKYRMKSDIEGGNEGEMIPLEEHTAQLQEIEQKSEELQNEVDRLTNEYEKLIQQSTEVLEILKYYNMKLLPILIQDEDIQLGLQEFMKRARKEIKGCDKEDIGEMLKDICLECLFSD